MIGPGGKNIRAIQEETGATIDVEDDGTVTVASVDRDSAHEALRRVEACTATVQIGKIYDGTVTSVRDFGAFVEILPGRDGLCHISELSNGFVQNVDSVCKVGDTMKVLVIDIDDHDRVKLSRRRALEELGLEDEFATVAVGADEEFEGDVEGGEAEVQNEAATMIVAHVKVVAAVLAESVNLAATIATDVVAAVVTVAAVDVVAVATEAAGIAAVADAVITDDNPFQ